MKTKEHLQIFIVWIWFININGIHKQKGKCMEEKAYNAYEECLGLVKQSGWMFINLPDEYKTEELCVKAVEQDDWAFDFVPDGLKEEVQIMLKEGHDGRRILRGPWR